MDLQNNNEMVQFEWMRNPEQKGEFLFSFGGEQVFNLFRDYPAALTKEQKKIFDEKNPYWAEFFKDRAMAQKKQ